MSELPTLSIVTPSLNQGHFIEQTILSVLDQGYPGLEYIVVDGGSTDGTLEILHHYGDRLKWNSSPDHSQGEAINKGLLKASGQIVAYLNSDDLYLPGALEQVGRFFAANPQAAWLTGYCRNIDGQGQEIRRLIRLYKNLWLRLWDYRALLVLNYIAQPATFWRREVMEQVGYLDEGLHYTLDYEYWLRIGRLHSLYVLHTDLAAFRVHSSSKSGTTARKQFDEELLVSQRYARGLPVWLHRIHRSLVVAVYSRMMATSQ